MSVFSARSRWIWLAEQPRENCYLHFRQHFCAASGPMRLLISAEGLYAAFLNGEYLPSTQYPDYPTAKAVQAIDLALPADAAEGVLDIQVYYPGIRSSISRVEVPGLRFELWQDSTLLCASNDQTLARPLPGYHSGPVDLINRHMGYGFRYSQPTDLPFSAATLSEKSCPTELRPIPELTVCPQRNVKIFSQGVFRRHGSGLQQYAALSFREWEELTSAIGKILPCPDGITLSSGEEDGIYLVVDLGEETVGYLTLDMVCSRQSPVEIGFGEHLEDLRVRTDVEGYHFTLQWEAPTARAPFIHRFHRTAGRYLQLFIYAKQVTVYNINLTSVVYSTRSDSAFACSDRLHEKIYQTAKHTLRSCLHEHYEDCPWREQALYAFDSRNQMLFGYYAFGEFRQPRANLKMLARSQREDGLLELCAPSSKPLDIPSFSLVFVLALEEYTRFSGDLTQALALYAGVCPEPRRKALRALLASGTLVPISLSASLFKYEALLQDGETYGPAVVEEVAQRWGNMLYNGATTLWETDLGAEDFNRAGSLCHAWSSVPIYIYGAYVLGVRPEKPGIWTRHQSIPSPILRARGTLYPPCGAMEVTGGSL